MNYQNIIFKGNVDWDSLDNFPLLEAMKNCPQNPEFHAEGDVLTHTKLVIEELLKLGELQELNAKERELMLFGALLHDVGKPATTILENDKIISQKHTLVGEKITREFLWNMEFEKREKICSLVRQHGLPVWTAYKANPTSAVSQSSLRIRNDHLSLLARADVLGRISIDKDDYLDRIEMFREICIENSCWVQEKEFFNSHSRFKFFVNKLNYPPELFDDTKFEVILMCGIPGSGKDSYANQTNLPLVSLDDNRKELRVKHGDKKGEGKVLQLAFEKAKEFCRKKQDFIWNSTNLTRDMRSKLIGLLSPYNPRFKIIYSETTFENIFKRRKDEIPEKDLFGMFRKLEMPDRSEAHEVIYLRN